MSRNLPINEQVRVPDLDQPTWLTDIPGDMPADLDATGHMQFNQQEHGHPGLLTIHGIRDGMHAIVEELEEHVEREARRDEIPDFLRPVLDAHSSMVLVRIDLAKAFRTDTFVIPAAPAGQSGGATLISNRSDRFRAIITNLGANPAFLSWTDDVMNFNSLGETAWSELGPSAAAVAAAASLDAFGAATGPGATTVITGATVSLPPGVWNVVWQIGYGAGAVAAAEANNMRLRQAGATVLNGIIAAVANTQVPQEPVTIIVPAGANQTIDIASIGAGTATANYEAQLVATQQVPPVSTTYAQIPNIREIRSGGKIYVYSPLGTQVDIQEEYGWRYSEEGILTP